MNHEEKSGGNGSPPIVEVLPSSGGAGGPLPPGQVATQIRGSYVTAVQVLRPRSLVEVQRRLQEEANLMGEAAYYGWGRGDNRVEGPSEALAFAAARCWGNTAIEYAPVEETSESYVFTATFIDLETGFTLQRPFRQSKRWVVHGRLDDFRKEDVRFQIGATKAARNVILKALPAWLVDGAMERAKSGVREKLERFVADKGLPAAQDLILRELGKHGVPEAAVLEKFGVAERKALDVDKLVILRGDLKAIQSGQERASELYGLGGASPAPEKGSIDPAKLKSAKPEDPPAEDPPTPPAGVDDGPALFTPERKAALIGQAESALGVGTNEAIKRLNAICADLCGSGLDGTPASFDSAIVKRLQKAAERSKK